MDIEIKYDGEYPNLCSGELIVVIDGKEWVFPDYCLSSGGYVSFDDDWNEHVGEGSWSVKNWPKDFPDNIKGAVVDAVNENVPHGCCGGCV
ncbi:MAG: hypothetical protein V2A54_08490 [Bacteroidota bacterium]